MGTDVQSFVVPFLGALQASIAVLLTIFAGVIASQFNLISEESSRDVSKVCVKLFMPALLIVNVGSELNLETVSLKFRKDANCTRLTLYRASDTLQSCCGA